MLYQGETSLLVFKLGERQFSVEQDSAVNLPVGSNVFVHVPPEDLLALKEE
ncbi:MAG: TOBE domain-containing protein [Pseudothermotoga sp.]|nr:TOBE domain-containing protein [Pseudothermotoga sp.]